MERRYISSGAKWESIVGYSRAVRVGRNVYVSGTTATDAQGNIVGRGDAHAQAVQAFRNIETALERAGASRSEVVRVRMFITRIEDWESVGRAHGEFFGLVQPAATLVAVSRLVDPEMLVEIDVDAVVAD